jgi:hypothetical protein
MQQSIVRGQILALATYQRARDLVPVAADPYAGLRDDPGLRSILLSSLYDDSVFYLMMAQALSPFGEASAAVREAAPFDTYPPFLSVVVALGGGAFDWRIAHAIVAVAFGASVFLLGRLARSVTRRVRPAPRS